MLKDQAGLKLSLLRADLQHNETLMQVSDNEEQVSGRYLKLLGDLPIQYHDNFLRSDLCLSILHVTL